MGDLPLGINAPAISSIKTRQTDIRNFKRGILGDKDFSGRTKQQFVAVAQPLWKENYNDHDCIVENVLETFFRNLSSNNFNLYLIHFKKLYFDNKTITKMMNL